MEYIMLFNIDSRSLVFVWIGLWSVLIAVVATSTSGCTGTARAESDREPVHAPEIHQIGERTTYMVDDTTITVEPGVLILYN